MDRSSGARLFLLVMAAGMKLHGADLAPERQTVYVTLRASLLEPGLTRGDRRPDDEMELGPVHWSSDRDGSTMARLWRVSARLGFRLTDDRQAFERLEVQPIYRGEVQDVWDVWRHRHGYQRLPGQRYVWSSVDESVEEISPDDGLFYDRYLKDVWSYWALQRLGRHLKTGTNRPPLPAAAEERIAMIHSPVEAVFSPEGRLQPMDVAFQINLWKTPVKVHFTVAATTSPAGGATLELPKGFSWTYDRYDWRRRHGYRRMLLGGYRWDHDFPVPERFHKQDGLRLDALMERTVAYWVGVAVEQVVANLEAQLAPRLAPPTLQGAPADH